MEANMASAETSGSRRGRPRASSHATIERIALELMQRDGYDAVTVDQIVEAAGISRTTFFRYFSSKSDVMWRSFDATIERLREELERGSTTAPLDAVRVGIVNSMRSTVMGSTAWLLRFQVLDRGPELHAESAQRWRRWRDVIAEFIAVRTGLPAGAPTPMAIAGACYGVLLSLLRSWTVDSEEQLFLDRLDDALRPVCDALATIVPDPPGPGGRNSG
jgi:AcrR family transcriptional regulator